MNKKSTRYNERLAVIVFMFLCLYVFISLAAPFALATGVGTQIEERHKSFFQTLGYNPDDPRSGSLAYWAGTIFKDLLLLVGILFLIFVVYSGIQWMMAGGNEETVKKARTRIIRATVGLIIILGAWIITTFFLRVSFGPTQRPATGLELGPIRLERVY